MDQIIAWLTRYLSTNRDGHIGPMFKQIKNKLLSQALYGAVIEQ